MTLRLIGAFEITYQLELLVQHLGDDVLGCDTLVDNVRGQVAFSDGTQDLTSLLVDDGQLIETLSIPKLALNAYNRLLYI